MRVSDLNPFPHFLAFYVFLLLVFLFDLNKDLEVIDYDDFYVADMVHCFKKILDLALLL